MRKLMFVAAMTVALAACGTDEDKANQNDLDAANATLNTIPIDGPAMNGAGADGGMGGNSDAANMANTTDAGTKNAMEKNLKTNDADTNLANGM